MSDKMIAVTIYKSPQVGSGKTTQIHKNLEQNWRKVCLFSSTSLKQIVLDLRSTVKHIHLDVGNSILESAQQLDVILFSLLVSH